MEDSIGTEETEGTEEEEGAGWGKGTDGTGTEEEEGAGWGKETDGTEGEEGVKILYSIGTKIFRLPNKF